jgi:hypothetical protein
MSPASWLSWPSTPTRPRVVEVAGDRVTARGVAQTMSELTGTPFKLQFAGTIGTLSLLAKAVRRFSNTTDAAFPAWQGMRYFVIMFRARPSCGTWTTKRPVRRPRMNDGAQRAGSVPGQPGPSMTDGSGRGVCLPIFQAWHRIQPETRISSVETTHRATPVVGQSAAFHTFAVGSLQQ